MSKSLGNSIEPQDIIKESGAEIIRLWVAMVDYREEVRLGKQILARVVEAYRKIRNTLPLPAVEPLRLRPGGRSRAARSHAGGRSVRARALRRRRARRCSRRTKPTTSRRSSSAINQFATVDSQRVLRRRLEGSALHVRRGIARAPLGADGDVRHRRRPGPAARADPADDGRRAVAAPARARARRRSTWPSSRRRCRRAARPDARRALGAADEDPRRGQPRRSKPSGRPRPSATRSARGSRCAPAATTRALLERYRDDLPMLFIVSQVELEPAGARDGPLEVEVTRAEGREVPALLADRARRFRRDAGTEGLCDRCVDALSRTTARVAG